MDIAHMLALAEGGWGAALLTASGVTLALSVLGFLLGAVFGALAADGRLSSRRIPSWLAKAYGTVFRGVPDLLTIYLLYYGGSIALTQLGGFFGSKGFVGLPTFATGVLALGIISGAYQGEVYRGAFHAIDRGQSFSLKPNHPNRIGPLKRPLHTIIPGMVTRNGRVEMPFGVMGGYYQALGHAHLISKVLDYGMDLQEAIDLPRVMPTSDGTMVEAEHTLDDATRAELERRGFSFSPAQDPIGGAQAIRIDWENGTLTGASEPRKDGMALGV